MRKVLDWCFALVGGWSLPPTVTEEKRAAWAQWGGLVPPKDGQ